MKASFFLQNSQKLADLKASLERAQTLEISACDFYFVSGFAGERSLLEVEITAQNQ